MLPGFIASWRVRAAQSTLSGRLSLWRRCADSFRRMKRKARTREGDAPVANVYRPDIEIIAMLRTIIAAGVLPRTVSNLLMKM